MKKLIPLFLVLALVMSLAGCGTAGTPDGPSSDADQSLKAEKKLVNVEVTLPSEFMEDVTQEDLDEQVAEGTFKSATLNEDGSATYVMSRSQHKKMMEQLQQDIQDTLSEMIGSEELPDVTDIKANSDFTEYEIYTTNTELSLMEMFMVLGLYMYGGYYTAFAGEPVDDITVTYYNSDSGDVIDTMTYKETAEAFDSWGEESEDTMDDTEDSFGDLDIEDAS